MRSSPCFAGQKLSNSAEEEDRAHIKNVALLLWFIKPHKTPDSVWGWSGSPDDWTFDTLRVCDSEKVAMQSTKQNTMSSGPRDIGEKSSYAE